MINLTNGDTLRLVLAFQHIGAAFTGARLYAAIGKKGLTFDEKIPQWLDLYNIVVDANWRVYSYQMDIPIANIGTIGFPAGTYEVYAKLTGIPGADLYWYGPLNDLNLQVVVAAQFKDLQVAYQKA